MGICGFMIEKGTPGLGVGKKMDKMMALERAGIVATSLGTMRRQLERCIGYASTRKQFGQPIGKFRSPTASSTARLMIYKVGSLMQRNKSAYVDAVMTKLYVSKSFGRSCLDAIQIQGGSGFMTELGWSMCLISPFSS